VPKRRNIQIGLIPGGPNPIDRGGLETAQNLNGISRPSINTTYDGSSGIKTASN
jgi:hypothetical protein